MQRSEMRMIDVTVLFLDGTFSSTAIGPMEVFRHAGELWNVLTGKPAAPRFRVTTASVRGRAVQCDGPIQIRPAAALTAIRKTELIFIPSTGPSVDDVVERNASDRKSTRLNSSHTVISYAVFCLKKKIDAKDVEIQVVTRLSALVLCSCFILSLSSQYLVFYPYSDYVNLHSFPTRRSSDLAVQCDGPIQIRPAAALTAIRKTELIFIPSTGPSVDDVVERNA